MPSFPFELVIPSFIAGLFTFLAPCTLPLVPGYLAYISGTSSRDLATTDSGGGQRKRVMASAVLFVSGFTFIFLIFGVAASRFGGALISYRSVLFPIGGAFLILFGLELAGLLHIAALSQHQAIALPARLRRGNKITAFLFGATFAVGWSPCIGPILGTILTIAATRGSETIGAVLLGSFALGLAVPFLLIGYSIGSASGRIASYLAFTERRKRWILGVMGIVVGFLFATILYAIPAIRATGIGKFALITLPMVLPLAGAWLIVRVGERTNADPVSFGGGITIVLLGILLALGKLGYLISYAFMILGRFGLGALENALMRFL
ncbi:MAG: cytochrome c biogenesis protein CcdA [Patescibacteria group bacterium]